MNEYMITRYVVYVECCDVFAPSVEEAAKVAVEKGDWEMPNYDPIETLSMDITLAPDEEVTLSKLPADIAQANAEAAALAEEFAA